MRHGPDSWSCIWTPCCDTRHVQCAVELVSWMDTRAGLPATPHGNRDVDETGASTSGQEQSAVNAEVQAGSPKSLPLSSHPSIESADTAQSSAPESSRRKSFTSNAAALDGALGSSKSFDNLSDLPSGSTESKWKSIILRALLRERFGNFGALTFVVVCCVRCYVQFFHCVVSLYQWNPRF